MSIFLTLGRWLDRFRYRHLVADSNETFDARWYAKQYPDIGGSWRDPHVHYLRYGRDEGRLPIRPDVDLSAYETARTTVADLFAIEAGQASDVRLMDVELLPLSRGRSTGLVVQGIRAFLSQVRQPVVHVCLVSGLKSVTAGNDLLCLVTDVEAVVGAKEDGICHLSDLIPGAPQPYRLALLDTILRLVRPVSISNLDSELGRLLYDGLTDEERQIWRRK